MQRSAVDAGVGGLLVVLLVWLGASGWRTYATHVLPGARVVPTATSTPVPDPAAEEARSRRARQVLDHVGAGNAFRQLGQRENALRAYATALALDPGNADARQNLRELGVEPPTPPPGVAVPTRPPPSPTPVPSVTPRI